jgi:hypothetical protein
VIKKARAWSMLVGGDVKIKTKQINQMPSKRINEGRKPPSSNFGIK